MKRLDQDAVKRFIDFCQGHVNTNLLFAPKVTIFAGQQAQISDEVHRPFVVGLRSVAEAIPAEKEKTNSTPPKIEPQLAIVSEGYSIQLSAYEHSPSKLVHLDWEIVESRIRDVAVGTVGQGEGKPPLSVQIPSVERRVCTASASLNSGESLLVHALEGGAKDRRRKYLVITPRVLDESKAK
jgi:hypothetical protein